jgi:D-alanyl-D-alanine carboxypeptidase (penicillin-binding protein 5/6)
MLCIVAGLFFLPPVRAAIPINAPEQVKQEVFAPSLPKLIVPVSVPVYAAENLAQPDETFPKVTASAIYVMDIPSGSILFEKNAQTARYPASTAKMMTALTVRKIFPLDKVLTVKQEAFTTGTVVGLHVGEQLTVKELLTALLIPSGNDAAFVLANNHPLGYQGFIAAMNSLAEELHLDETKFANPSGLDTQEQTSTAHDLAILAKELMKDDVLRSIVSTKTTVVHDTTGEVSHPVTSTQELFLIFK